VANCGFLWWWQKGPFQLVFGVFHGGNRGGRGKGEKIGENAQFLKVIERRYVLWMEPLVKEEDVE
jgi:hypothetical protein